MRIDKATRRAEPISKSFNERRTSCSSAKHVFVRRTSQHDKVRRGWSCDIPEQHDSGRRASIATILAFRPCDHRPYYRRRHYLLLGLHSSCRLDRQLRDQCCGRGDWRCWMLEDRNSHEDPEEGALGDDAAAAAVATS